MRRNTNTLQHNTYFILLLIFAVAIIQRSSTFFVEFYDLDILAVLVQVREFFAGRIPGIDYEESKLALYQLIFKLGYSILPHYAWIIPSLIACLAIFGTSLFLFHFGKDLFDKRSGLIAALFYSALISSFNRHFMSLNAEVFFNLPLTGSLYYLYRYETRRKLIYLVLSIAFAMIATQVKVHTYIIFPCIAFYLLFQKRWVEEQWKSNHTKEVIVIVTFICAPFLINPYLAQLAVSFLTNLYDTWVTYVTSRPFSIPRFILYTIHRIGIFTVNHAVLWIPLFIFMKHLPIHIKSKSKKELMLATFFIFNLLPAFSGGTRLYFHYFIQAYPMLCLIAAYQWVKWIDTTPNPRKTKRKLGILLAIPMAIYLTWNYYGVYIRYFNPALFYNEPKFITYLRLGLMANTKDYLLPRKSCRDAILFINKRKKPGQRLFSWGNAPVINYYTELKLGYQTVWMESGAIHYLKNINSGNPEKVKKAKAWMSNLIRQLQKNKPEFIVDLTPADINQFNTARFSLDKFPPLKNYILNNYSKIAVVSGIPIYQRSHQRH